MRAVLDHCTGGTGRQVAAGTLSTTGLSQPWLPVLGGGLLLGALGLIRSRRRLHAGQT